MLGNLAYLHPYLTLSISRSFLSHPVTLSFSFYLSIYTYIHKKSKDTFLRPLQHTGCPIILGRSSAVTTYLCTSGKEYGSPCTLAAYDIIVVMISRGGHAQSPSKHQSYLKRSGNMPAFSICLSPFDSHTRDVSLIFISFYLSNLLSLSLLPLSLFHSLSICLSPSDFLTSDVYDR